MKLVSEDILRIGNKLFLFSNTVNLLYSVDICDGHYEFLGSIPNKDIFEMNLVSSIIVWNGRLYLIPLMEGNVWIYSIDTGEWDEIKIEPCKIIEKKPYFRNAIINDGKIYIFGGYYPRVVQIDLMTKNVRYDFVAYDYKENREREVFFRGAPIQKGEYIYLASANDNSILKYSLSNQGYEWIKVGAEGDKFSGIEWDGNCFWLAPRHNGHDILKITDGKETRYSLPAELNGKESLYIGLCKYTEGLFITAWCGENGTIMFYSDHGFEITNKYYSFYKKKEGELFTQQRNGKIEYVDNEGSIRNYLVEISAGSLVKMISNIKGIDGYKLRVHQIENEGFNLKDFIALTQ